jgi:hypothetical protein
MAMAEQPNARGIAVFYPKVGEAQGAIDFEGFFRQYSGFMHYFGSNMPKIIRGKPQSSTRVEYWVIPPNSDEPNIELAKPGEIFELVSKPFLYNTEFGGEVCPPADPSLIANLLETNPNVNLKIIVRGRTSKYRKTKMNKWLRVLVGDNKVARDRIRVVLTSKLNNVYPYQDVEFWFVTTK